MKNEHNYNELVDHLVSTMKPNMSPKSSQQSYQEYVAKVNKERDQIDVHNLTETIMRLGYKIDNAFAKLIDSLDNITNDKFDPENVTCSIDNEQVDCDKLGDNIYAIDDTYNPPNHPS